MFPSLIPAAVAQLLVFLSFHRESLLQATHLLGGALAARRTLDLFDTLSTTPQITRRVARELVVLHRLLSLQDVADFDRPEAYHFAFIEPTHAAVADICLLTDGLTECLHALVAEDLVDTSQFDIAA